MLSPIQLPQRVAKKDALDKILQGLQIAEGVFKIPVAYKQIEHYGVETRAKEAEAALKEQELATKKRNQDLVFTPPELAAAKLIPAAADDKNAFDVNVMIPNGEYQPLRVKPQADIGQIENLLDIRLKSNELNMAPAKRAKMQIDLDAAREGLDTPKPEQAISAGFAARMARADDIVQKLEAAGHDPASFRAGIENSPLVPNFLSRGSTQQYRQAQADWVTANLRKESGANIPEKEMQAEIRKYFPQTGDSPETIEQKALSRLQSRQNLELSAGPRALGKLPTAPLPGVKKQQGGGFIPEAVAAGAPSIPLDAIDAELQRRARAKKR